MKPSTESNCPDTAGAQHKADTDNGMYLELYQWIAECVLLYVIYEIPCIDEDMSNPDEALDTLWEVICMDGMQSQDF